MDQGALERQYRLYEQSTGDYLPLFQHVEVAPYLSEIVPPPLVSTASKMRKALLHVPSRPSLVPNALAQIGTNSSGVAP